MNHNLKKFVDDIERLVTKAAADHPGPSLISLAPSIQSPDKLEPIPEAVLFTCIFVGLKQDPHFVDGVREILQRRCSFDVTHDHAVAFATMAQNVEAGAEAEALDLGLTIFPNGMIWSYSHSATILWTKGQWFGFAPRFEKANGPMRAYYLSQSAFEAMPDMMKPDKS